jgi:hypothetical protein
VREFAAQTSGIPKAEERCALGWFNFGDKAAVHEKNVVAGDISSPGTISGVPGEVKVVALTRKRNGDYS